MVTLLEKRSHWLQKYYLEVTTYLSIKEWEFRNYRSIERCTSKCRSFPCCSLVPVLVLCTYIRLMHITEGLDRGPCHNNFQKENLLMLNQRMHAFPFSNGGGLAASKFEQTYKATQNYGQNGCRIVELICSKQVRHRQCRYCRSVQARILRNGRDVIDVFLLDDLK